MPRNSAYKIRIKTDSADNNALLLLYDGELIAVLVELADDCHGDARGQWIIEAIYGLYSGRARPETFTSAEEAAKWIGQHIGQRALVLSQNIRELS